MNLPLIYQSSLCTQDVVHSRKLAGTLEVAGAFGQRGNKRNDGEFVKSQAMSNPKSYALQASVLTHSVFLFSLAELGFTSMTILCPLLVP